MYMESQRTKHDVGLIVEKRALTKFVAALGEMGVSAEVMDVDNLEGVKRAVNMINLSSYVDDRRAVWAYPDSEIKNLQKSIYAKRRSLDEAGLQRQLEKDLIPVKIMDTTMYPAELSAICIASQLEPSV